jgi:hypothetical protein
MISFAKKYYVPLAMFVALAFFPDRGDQWRYSFVLAASFLVMAFFGHVGMLAFSLDKRLMGAAFFLKCCIGQIVLLLFWMVVSPLVFLYKVKLGLPLSLPILVLGLVAIAIFYIRSGSLFTKSLRYDDPILATLMFFAMVCFFKLASYYSYNVGALGLDTHQHIYYASDLYDAAYLKLAARGTEWLDQYSKGLHALVALWAVPGFGSYIGPAVKVMPALQALLIAFAFVEVCYLWLQKQDFASSLRWVWISLVLLLLYYEIFYGSKLIYPIADLNSTGRTSSAVVMLLPGLIGFSGTIFPSRRMVTLNWLMLPLCGALAVKINPALSIAFIGFSSLLWAVLAIYGLKNNLAMALYGLAFGVLSGTILVFTDPYYLGMLASKVGVVREILSQVNIAILAHADGALVVRSHLLSQLWLGAVQALKSLADHGLVASIYPDSSMLLSPGGASVIRDVALCVLCAWFLLTCIVSGRKRGLFPQRFPILILQLGLFAGCFLNLLIAKMTTSIFGVATRETSLLASYAQSYASLLTMFLVPVFGVLMITMVIDSAGFLVNGRLSRFNNERVGRFHAVCSFVATASVCLVLVGYAVLLRRTVPKHLPAEFKAGWWNPVKEKAIWEFWKVEGMVPDDGLILAESVPAKLNEDEGWILPVGGAGTPYLPFAKGKYVFNVELGAGYGFTYDDAYESFCTGDAEAARKFLKKNNIKYLFSPGSEDLDKGTFLNKMYCRVSYRDMGVEYPAAFTGKYGIGFYRINISREGLSNEVDRVGRE